MRTILVFNEIGGMGTTSEMFARELEFANGEDIEVRINSVGGEVQEGITIYNLLKSYAGNVKVIVDGWAASIASIIALGGDELVMNEGSFIMIHNPWTGMMGEAKDLRQEADLLDLMTNELVNIYVQATGLDEGEIRQMMDEETWLNPTDAIEKGFANSVATFNKVAACVSKDQKTKYFYKNAPMELSEMNQKEVIHNEVAEAELEVQEEALVEEEIEQEVEFEDLEIIAAAEEALLEEDLEEELAAIEEEEIEEESEYFTLEEMELYAAEKLEEEFIRQAEIKALAFKGQEDLVEELIKEKSTIVDAQKRIIQNAKELQLTANREEVEKGDILKKLNSNAPKALDLKESEEETIESLRKLAAKEKNPSAKREIIKKINKLK
jgi:ATP-dependent protease ClpP protease subunit